jgi:hypothetical protein
MARAGKRLDAYRLLVRKREGKIPFCKSRSIVENNIKLDFKEIKWKSLYWIRLSQDRTINDSSVVSGLRSAPPTKHRGPQ